MPLSAFSELVEIVGTEHCRSDPGADYAVDGVSAGCLVSPADAAQAAAVVRACARRGWRINVRGAGTKQDIGNVPERIDVVLSTARMRKVRDYTPRDQTISVEAGMPLAELRAVLAGEGQRLPIDPPHADKCTIGGVVAADSNGPLRFGCGTIRDYIIGIEFVTPEGVIAKAGGKVVKNVAGYNLMQLHTGAFGQLGVITALNFKLRPVAKAEAMVRCAVGAKAEEVVAALLLSDVRPVFLEYFAGPAAGNRELSIGFAEDAKAAVDWQCSRAVALLTDKLGLKPAILTGPEYAEALPGLEENFRRDALFKAACPSSRAAEMVERALDLLKDVSPPLRWVVQSSIGNGIFYGCPVNDAGEEMPHWAEALKPEPTAAALAKLRHELSLLGGSLVFQHAPASLKRLQPVWGPPRGDWEMMAKVKQAFDPAGILNVGRLI